MCPLMRTDIQVATVILLATITGCQSAVQTVRVQSTAPPAQIEKSTVTVSYEVQFK